MSAVVTKPVLIKSYLLSPSSLILVVPVWLGLACTTGEAQMKWSSLPHLATLMRTIEVVFSLAFVSWVPELLTKFDSFGYFSKKFNNFVWIYTRKFIYFPCITLGKWAGSLWLMVDAGHTCCWRHEHVYAWTCVCCSNYFMRSFFCLLFEVWGPLIFKVNFDIFQPEKWKLTYQNVF